jgi:hypothetical protein
MSLLLVLLLCAVPASAQQWTADVYAGGTQYDALASFVGAANVAGNVRFESPRTFAYLSAAAPLDNDAPVWSALGGGLRVAHGVGGRFRIGLDAGGDGYAFRYTDSTSGTGVTTHLLPLVALTRGAFDLRLRGGRRDHHADRPLAKTSRHMYEAGARGMVGNDSRIAIAEVRVLTAPGEMHSVAQAQVGSSFGRAQVWASAGRWFGDLRETVWSAGASITAGRRGEAWAGVHRDVEPLYQSPVRTSWNIGYSLKLGRIARPLNAPVLRDGVVIVRLPRDSRSTAAPAVAGEFSDWQPLPMRAAGDEWVIEITAGPGVYRFAFVTADGEWFVPEGYPGRMDDDMGGHVAVVVVR